MTKYYLSKTATTPALTDVPPTANTPSGAGNFTLHTPGTLVTTAPTLGAATTTTLSGPIGPSAVRGMIWETLAGVPNQATFTTPGFELCLRVTALSGTSAACLINARIVRLDTTAGVNEIVEIGGDGDGFAISSTSFAQHNLPITATIQIPPSTFSAGSAADRLGVQVWILNQNGANSITTFSVETDSHFSFLTNELRMQFAEGFDHIAPSTFLSSAFCSPGAPNFGPGCGTALNTAGLIPSNNVAGAAALAMSGGSYTLVTGWNGDGYALQNPVNVQFTTENAKLRNTWHIGCRFRPDDTTAQQIVSIGSAAGRVLSIDLLANGTIQVYVGGSGALGGSLKATSTNTSLVAGTWYHIEFAGYISTTVGTLQVLVNGVAVTWDSSVAAINCASSGTTGCFWNTLHGTIDDVYGYAGQGSLTQVQYLASTTSLPIMATLLPVGQGSQQDWDNISHVISSDAGVTNGVSKDNNWTFVSETQNTGPLSILQGSGIGTEDLWIFAGAPEGTGEIIALITNFTVGAGGDLNWESHEIRVGGTTYKISDLPTGISDLDYECITPGAQHAYRARLWPAPAGDPWLSSDLTAFEAGLYSIFAIPMFCTQARVIVMYYEAIPVEVSTETGPCEPCTNTLDAFFVDSGLIYDGRNSVDGGVTTSTSTMTLSLTPAGDWTTVGGEHLLTCSTALFTAGDSFYVGKAMRLTGSDGEEVVCDIIDHNAGDSTLDVTIRSAVPLSLQNIATSEWALMINEITMAHLEGETISILADGVVQDQEVVGRGAVTLADHFAVVTAGLPITATLHTLPIDSPGAPSAVRDLPKDVPEVSVIVESSTTFKIGARHTSLDPVTADPDAGENDLVSRVVGNIQRRDHQWGDGGSTWIVQDDPVPLTILGIISHVQTGKH